MPKNRTAPLTEEEKRERQREYQRRYLEKKAAKEGKPPPKQRTLFPPSECTLTEPLPVGADPAATAAIMNEKHGYSVIVGEARRGKKTVIAERLRGKTNPESDGQYRLKITAYEYFGSLGDLKMYCLRNKIPLTYN